NVRLDPDNPQAGFLLDAFQPAFQVFVFGDDQRLWDQAAADVAALRERGIATRLIGIRRHSTLPTNADAAFQDAGGHVHQAWGVNGPAIYVLRPDQHVAARWLASSPQTVLGAIEH